MVALIGRITKTTTQQVGIFNNNHRAGGGLPAMGDLQWKDVKQHLERHIFEQVLSH